jgi:hypothetical protein
LLYRQRRQARLVAQGATEAEFDRWMIKFEPSLTSFDFGGDSMPS